MKHATDEKLKTNPSMSKNELASSRDKFRTLFESSPIDMVLMDLEGNIIDINDAGVELHGYSSRNELIGKNCFLLVDEEYREEAKIKWLEAISLGHVKDFELALLKKDGQKFSTLVNASCLRNSSGESYAMLAIVMDISERKKVEAALRRSERSIRENKDKFKALIETNVDFIWEMDEKGKYTYCSPQMEKLWNLKPGEMLGKSPFDILPHDMRETAENIFFRLIENPQPFNNLEAISLDGKGNLINIEISGVPFYDEKGKFSGYRGITRDITQRKNAEKALQESESRFRSVLDTSPDVIYRLNILKGFFDYISPSCETVVGFKPEELMSLDAESSLAMIHPDDLSVMHLAIKNIEKTGREIAEYRQITKSGEYRWLSNQMSVTRDYTGRILYRNGHIRDISRQKAAEAKLKELNETLEKQVEERSKELKEQSHFIQKITDSTPDILFVFDVKELKVIFLSKGVAALGYHPEQFRSWEKIIFQNIIHPDDFPGIIANMKSNYVINPGEVLEFSCRIRNSHGYWRWNNIRITFFKGDTDGSTKQILGIARDITQRKEAEIAYSEEKTINAELKRMNELMDTFVFAAAHDLKAPLSNLRLIDNLIESTDDPEKKIRLQKRNAAVINQLDDTISGLVKVLSIEKDSVADSERVSFQEVFDATVNELFDKIYAVNPAINIDFRKCQSIIYIESYLSSIFRNLLSNSLKYRKDRENLVINISTRRAGKKIILTYCDNGIGIDLEKFQDDIFKPFRRFSNHSNGSGIGLYLIRGMVTKNGGNIMLESKAGQGTTFRISLVQYS